MFIILLKHTKKRIIPVVRVNPDKLISTSDVGVDCLKARVAHQTTHRWLTALASAQAAVRACAISCI